MNRLGWIRDLPDHRDYKYSLPTQLELPPSTTLNHTTIYNQGQLGSCTAQATSSAFQFLHPTYKPSRLFLYYNTRLLEGTIPYDSGASIRDTFKSLSQYGVAPEYTYPYNTLNFKRKPSPTAYKRALSHQALLYQSIPSSSYMLNACIAEGYPFVFGFSIFESFYTDSPYKVVPQFNESFIGGHAVMCIGYTTTHYICQNSWGLSWGDHGIFYLPISYITNPQLADDFWTLRSAEPEHSRP